MPVDRSEEGDAETQSLTTLPSRVAMMLAGFTFLWMMPLRDASVPQGGRRCRGRRCRASMPRPAISASDSAAVEHDQGERILRVFQRAADTTPDGSEAATSYPVLGDVAEGKDTPWPESDDDRQRVAAADAPVHGKIRRRGW